MIEGNEAPNLKFCDIHVGDVFQFTRVISKQNVMEFAKFTGDYNPLHVDPEFADKTTFKKNIVHGLLTGCLFSTLIGMYCPGRNALYLSQTYNFRLPVFYSDVVTIKGTVIDKNESIRLIILKTEILKDQTIVTSGEAKVKVLDDNDEK